MVDRPTLTARQERLVTAMLTARSIKSAAALVGCNEKTARTWLKQEPVKRALAERISEHLAASAAISSGALFEALDTLRAVMSAPETPPAVKVSAARAILEGSQRAIELHSFDARLAALEGKTE